MRFRVVSKVIFVLTVVLLGVGLGGCGGGVASGGTSVVATLSGATLQYILVTPGVPPVLPVGGAQQFVATGYYSDGSAQNISSTATWTSSSPATATISASGAASAVALGNTSITAAAGGIVSLPVPLYTMEAKLVSMSISSTNPTSIAVGQPTQFTVRGTYSNGFSQDITPAVTWNSNSVYPYVWITGYTSTTPGVVTGQSPGTTNISATDNLTGITSNAVSLAVTNTYVVGGTKMNWHSGGTSLLPAGGTVTLQNTIVSGGVTSTDTVTINANGDFYFPTALAPGSTYQVSIVSQVVPAGAHPCTVLDGTGLIDSLSPMPALNVQVVCGAAVGTLTGSSMGMKDGAPGVAQFDMPGGLAYNSATSQVYVADSQNNNIRVVSASGVVSTLAGSTLGSAGSSGYFNGTGTSAMFNGPSGLAFDPHVGTAGALYVADTGNNAIRKIDLATLAVTTYAGSITGAAGSADGTSTAASFSYPTGVAVDSSGNLYVTDGTGLNGDIRKITTAQVVSHLTPIGSFYNPWGIAVNSTTGMVYVAEYGSCVIDAVTSTGSISILAGRKVNIVGSFGDGIGADAAFYNPSGLTIDASGNLYVADATNSSLRKIDTATAAVTTLAGNWMNNRSGGDGPVATATVGLPTGVVIDPSGNIYLTDGGASLRKYTP